MNFEYSEEQEMFRDAIMRFGRERYDPIRRLDYLCQPHAFDKNGWARLSDCGIWALPFSEEQGGLNAAPSDILAVMEAVGRSFLVEPVLTLGLMGGIGLAHYGTARQLDHLVAPVIDGSIRIALAHAESAYEPDSIKTRAIAHHNGQDAVLNGQKRFCLSGDAADFFIISAQNTAGSLGLYLVSAKAEGLSQHKYRLLDGSHVVDLKLDNVRGDVMASAIHADDNYFQLIRIAIVAESVGLLGSMFDTTLDYLKIREQFGRPIGKFQALQHRMASHYATLEILRSGLYFAVATFESTGDHALIHGAKALISSAGLDMAEDFLQMHGGIGMTEEAAVSQAFRRFMLLTGLFGAAKDEYKRYDQSNTAIKDHNPGDKYWNQSLAC